MADDHVGEAPRAGRYRRLCPALAAVLIALTAALCAFLRPAADDFFYVTFLDGGLRGFLEKTAEHYRTMTGRVLVHLVLCPLLSFDMWPFRVFNILLICGLCALGARLCAVRAGERLSAFVALLSLFWLMGIGTLSDGALWGAGALNYLFPVALVVLYYALLQDRLSRGAPVGRLCVAAALCASTVEMTGLLVPLAVLYLALCERRAAGKQRAAVALDLGGALAGYLFLFTSGGVATRLEQNEFAAVGLLRRIEINYALFDRMICGPEGIWPIVALALLSGAYVLRKKAAKAALAATAVLILLTGTGVIYGGRPLAAIAALAFAALCAYGVWAFCAGERLIPFCMLCVSVSLAVCMVSPVAGPRMVLPSGVFLSLVCVRGLFLRGVPRRAMACLLSGATLLAALMLVSCTIHFADNARVIDRNARAALRARAEGAETLRLFAVPDEFYGGATVPSDAAWGGSFRAHYALEDVALAYEDPTAVPLLFGGKPLERAAVLRGGQYYVPIRTAADVCGAAVDWAFSCAVVRTADGRTVCLHAGSRAANLGHGVVPSLRLSDPVRSVNSSIYISLRDFEALFGVAPALSGA